MLTSNAVNNGLTVTVKVKRWELLKIMCLLNEHADSYDFATDCWSRDVRNKLRQQLDAFDHKKGEGNGKV